MRNSSRLMEGDRRMGGRPREGNKRRTRRAVERRLWVRQSERERRQATAARIGMAL